MSPISASAALTGTGLGLMKLTRIRSSRRSWSARASAQSPARASAAQPRHLGRDLVGGDRDDAVATERQQRIGPGVVTRQDREARRPVAQDGHDLLQVRGRLLDRHDAGVLGEAQQRRRIHVAAGPAGHVVDDDRQAALIRDRPVVGLEHPLVGLVVVRRDHERRVGAQGRRSSGRRDDGRRVVRAGAGDDRDASGEPAPCDRLDGQADEAVVLLVGGRGRLAGRATGHEAVDAQVQLALHEARNAASSTLAVAREGGHERREGAPEGECGVGWVVSVVIGRSLVGGR